MSRGRKRKPGRREPNGRESRRKLDVALRTMETEADVKATALEARARHTGLPLAVVETVDTTKPHAGTLHGVLALQRLLTADQWETAEWYLEKRRAYQSAILAPGNGIVCEGSVRSTEDSDSYTRWTREARDLWEDGVIPCLQEASTQSRSPIIAALNIVVGEGIRMDHLNGDVRLGLNAIRRTFIETKRRAA